MRVFRIKGSLRIVMVTRRSFCLHRLSLKCGYRVSEVCRLIQCDAKTLYSAFVADLGLSPKQWMRQERMVVAARMLSAGKYVFDVSDALGFNGIQNFAREFRVFYQVSPAQYQRDRRTTLSGEYLPPPKPARKRRPDPPS